MASPPDPRGFATQLLQQDQPLSDTEYQAYRQKLERALAAAERKAKWAYWVTLGAFAVALALMFVGGSKVIGDFDPWSRNATPWSVTAGLIYALAAVTFPLSMGTHYWFRSRVQGAKDRLRDATLLDLQRQLVELRNQLPPAPRRDVPGQETPPQGGPSHADPP